MNLSGEAVLAAMSFFKIKPEDVIVFHDEMALPVGKVKVKTGGSSAGHNGIKNIEEDFHEKNTGKVGLLESYL